MKPHAMARLVCAALLSALMGCAGLAVLPPPPPHPNGQVLWRIVHEECVPGQREHHMPAPCALVSMAEGEAHGFVLLKDRVGVAQYLLMPTARMSGIEDRAVLAPDAPNYFALAWDARHLLQERLDRPLDWTQVSITVNSAYGRSQDHLHLHIDCIDPAVADALRAASIPASGAWASRAIELKGHRYRVRWLDANELSPTNPFQLLARTMPGARQAMGAWTIALVGAARPNGLRGFYLLANRAEPAAGDPASSEELQDHTCGL